MKFWSPASSKASLAPPPLSPDTATVPEVADARLAAAPQLHQHQPQQSPPQSRRLYAPGAKAATVQTCMDLPGLLASESDSGNQGAAATQPTTAGTIAAVDPVTVTTGTGKKNKSSGSRLENGDSGFIDDEAGAAVCDGQPLSPIATARAPTASVVGADSLTVPGDATPQDSKKQVDSSGRPLPHSPACADLSRIDSGDELLADSAASPASPTISVGSHGSSGNGGGDGQGGQGGTNMDTHNGATQHGKKKWWNVFVPAATGHLHSKHHQHADRSPPPPSNNNTNSSQHRLADVREEDVATDRQDRMASIDGPETDIEPNVDTLAVLSQAPPPQQQVLPPTSAKMRSPDAIKKVTGFMKHLHVGPSRAKKAANNNESRSGRPSLDGAASTTSPAVASLQAAAGHEAPAAATARVAIQTPCRNPRVLRREATKSEEESKLFRRREILNVMRREYTLPREFREKYELLDLLGDGAFGFVFLARVKSPRRQGNSPERAAVKFIIRDKLSLDGWANDETYGFIPFEAHFIKQLSHPNIIQFMDLFMDDRFFYLVTEFHGAEWTPSNPLLNPEQNPGLRNCAEKVQPPTPLMSLDHRKFTDDQLLQKKRTACDLFECIDAHRRIPESTAKYILVQIVDALTYLLDIGFVHRDLKDENVVIDQHYHVKLIDFGSTSPVPQLGDTAHYFDRFNGTLHFASPEILQGRFYRGPEADVWALGVLLFTILFGENPFPNPDDIVKMNVRFPSEPAGAVDLMKRMLEVDPDKRATLAEVRSHPWFSDVKPVH